MYPAPARTLGPGLVVMAADNDAGGISTYAQAGQDYGVRIAWLVVLLVQPRHLPVRQSPRRRHRRKFALAVTSCHQLFQCELHSDPPIWRFLKT
jgi:hypothetical protein